ncbi:MAG: sodium-dependent transporter [Desulfovibrionaceae bacterium]
MNTAREQLSSRLGFLLVAAGCAIGLGNVWRFPYITGVYGGAAFVLLYLLFLTVVGLPILVMEFSVGRASRQNMGRAFHTLEPKGTYWHVFGRLGLIGSYTLMLFYTTVSGWMLAYCVATATGELSALSPPQVGEFFGNMLGNISLQSFWMTVTVVLGFSVCALGLRNGVERVVKNMMLGLLLILFVLVGRAVTLPGAEEGIRFYLLPDLNRMLEAGFWSAVNAAMTQAFFTLSVGIGCMSILGSYIDKSQTLTGEGAYILGLDTFVALMSGLIIFPACSAFNVDANSGPGLIFVTLPNIFNNMAFGQLWGTLFFIFMSFAALSTVIAVFENIISYCIDVHGWPRKKAVWINGIVLYILCFPCILGFNLWSSFEPLGPKTNILDLEDFLISNNLLPLGALVFLLFCCHSRGWGWHNFLKEANTGRGLRFPTGIRWYMIYVLPCIIVFVLVKGYMEKFHWAF